VFLFIKYFSQSQTATITLDAVASANRVVKRAMAGSIPIKQVVGSMGMLPAIVMLAISTATLTTSL
jgi:hypothetical protein